jgi:hypothetical protein
MSTDTKKAELEKWLTKLNPNLAKQLRDAYGSLAQDAKTNPKNAAADSLAEQGLITAAKGAVTAGKIIKETAAEDAKWEKKSELSSDAIQTLVMMLQMWGDDKFLATRKAPESLVSTKNPFVDKLVSQTVDVLKARNDMDKMGKTIETWRQVRKSFQTVLRNAEQNFTQKKNQPKHKDADIVLALIPDGLKALDAIEWYIGQNHADYQQREAEKTTAVPEMGEKVALRELKKLEPTMNVLAKAATQVGEIAKGAHGEKLEKAAQVAKIYLSIHEMSEALEKFREAGFAEKAKTVTDLTAFLVDTTNEAYKAYLEGAKELAEKLGKEEVAKALGKRIEVLKKVATVVAAYELGKNIGELAVAIKKGDWKKIGEAGYGVVSGGVSLAETAGVMSAEAGMTVNASAVAVWGVIESIRLAGEIIRWAKAATAMDAVKDLLKDANAIVPKGKAMAVAADLMLAADPNSTEYEVHEATMEKMLPEVKQRITALYDYHFQPTKNPKIVGSYPELIVAFGSKAANAGAGLSYPDDALSQSQRFLEIVKGVKAVVEKGDKLWGDEV